jgi:hypothetical protein
VANEIRRAKRDNGWRVDLMPEAWAPGVGGGEHLDAGIETDKRSRGVEPSLRRMFRQRERDDLTAV